LREHVRSVSAWLSSDSTSAENGVAFKTIPLSLMYPMGVKLASELLPVVAVEKMTFGARR
jgi:hypothetical protein